MRRLFIAISLFFYAAISFAQNSIKVEAHNVVAMDEQFNVTFIIEGENSPSDFTWNPGSDFQLLWGPQHGQSTSIQIINGKRSKSVQSTYTYVLRPVKAGKFSLQQASAKVKGKEIHSDPFTVEVVSASSSQSSRPSSQNSQHSELQNDDLMLTLTLSRTDVVVGEPIIATIKLYQRVNVAGFESVEFPSYDGFWSQELEAPTNIEFTRETYEGQIYNSALLRRVVLVPQQQGKLTIEPAQLVCLVNVRVSSGGASIFDGFFDDYRSVRRRVESKPVTVNVSALPSGAPSSFGGGVGQFTISAKVSKDSLKTHEAASLLVTVAGTGNVSLLEAPKVSFPPDMEVYDTKVSDKLSKGGISGSRFYEFPFIPRSHGDFVIEPIKYSYYDVGAKKYVTLQTPAIPLHVARNGEAEESVNIIVPGMVKKDVKNVGSDIRFINTRTQDFSPVGSFLLCSSLFWIITLLIVAIAVVLWAALRKVAVRRADVVGTKNRKATKMALKRLNLASTFLKQDLYTAFYEELHKALLGFISDKLNISVSELSRDRIAETLAAGGVNEEAISGFISLIDACEFARYSPDAGHDAMEAHYNSALDIISLIDSNMKAKKNSGSKSLMALLVLLSVSMTSQAQTTDLADSLWNAANIAYTEGRWADALADYCGISDLGLESPALYCNIADAYYKDGNMAKAILYYERALKLDPSYADARFNLEFLDYGIQDRIDPVPEFILSVWARKACWIMDSDAWVVCFFIFLALTLGLALLFVLSPSVGGRRVGFFAGIVTLLLAIAAVSFAAWQKEDYMKADRAVIMRPVVAVKSSPSSDTSKDLFILHEGTRVSVLDAVGRWKNIELADGRQGWIQADDIEII